MLMVALTAACEGTKSTGIGTNCPDVLRPSIVAEIRDVNGKPTAIGATVSAFRSDQLLSASKPMGDSLRAFVYGPIGTVDVVVTKPSFKTALLSEVTIPQTVCGSGTVTVAVKLLAVAN